MNGVHGALRSCCSFCPALRRVRHMAMAHMTPWIRGPEQGVDVSVKRVWRRISARNVYRTNGAANRREKRVSLVTNYLQGGVKNCQAVYHGVCRSNCLVRNLRVCAITVGAGRAALRLPAMASVQAATSYLRASSPARPAPTKLSDRPPHRSGFGREASLNSPPPRGCAAPTVIVQIFRFLTRQLPTVACRNAFESVAPA